MACARSPNMATFISNSPADTQAFGTRFGQQAVSGLVIGLTGDLGAGKTQFVKGVAHGLGVSEAVLSPSFGLLHVYSTGRLPLFHLDFYRLDTTAQIVAAGLEEYLEPAGVTLVEWWDRWQGAKPLHLLQLRFETINETQRRIVYDDPGA